MRPTHNDLVSEINFIPIRPRDGLIGFASFIFQGSIYLGNIAVHTRPNGGIRLVYPRTKGVNIYYPLNKELGKSLEMAIEMKCDSLYK